VRENEPRAKPSIDVHVVVDDRADDRADDNRG
jgi:hypothetical protein